MKTLVIAEHNSENLSAATLSVVDAAKKLGRDIDLLVANNSCSSVLDEAKSVEGVSTVLNSVMKNLQMKLQKILQLVLFQ